MSCHSDQVCQTYYESPLGSLSILTRGDSVVGVYFLNQKYYQAGFEDVKIEDRETEAGRSVKRWLEAYFAKEMMLSDLPRLAIHGTEFQKTVWLALLEIPFGKVVTYADLGKQVGCISARAIGRAVGRNPISLLIPCHRVIGSNGKLTGYAGGLERKKHLLEWEQNETLLRIPKMLDL